jgi:hypothetical protein
MSENINDLLTTVSNFIEAVTEDADWEELSPQKQAAQEAMVKLYDMLSPEKAVMRDQCLGGKPWL